MQTIAKWVTSAAIAALVSGALASAGPAAADPPSGTAADSVVRHLEDEGYTVAFNMPSTMDLSRCTVSGISGLTVMMMPDGSLGMMMAPDSQNTTVYVTLNCPSSNN